MGKLEAIATIMVVGLIAYIIYKLSGWSVPTPDWYKRNPPPEVTLTKENIDLYLSELYDYISSKAFGGR